MIDNKAGEISPSGQALSGGNQRRSSSGKPHDRATPFHVEERARVVGRKSKSHADRPWRAEARILLISSELDELLGMTTASCDDRGE